MAGQQKTFADIADDLDPRARELLSMPAYAQVDENLVNMANFFPLIQPIIDAAAPSSICEIGSDQGMTTNLLKQYCHDNSCVLHSVDPCFSTTEQVDERTYLHSCLSFEYLSNSEPSEVYFVDGDHNYYTAATELELIRNRKPSGQPCVVFLHDVAWPWGKIDMYYDEGNIPKSHRKNTVANPLLSLFLGADTTKGQGLPMNGLNVAVLDDRPAGIATAIEEFLEVSEGWEYMTIPSIFGLGVLIFRGTEPSELGSEFDKLKGMFDRFAPFLSILEFNRITLLEKVNQSGFLWSRQHEAIEEYDKRIHELRQEARAYDEMHAANKAMVKDIEVLQGYTGELESKIQNAEKLQSRNQKLEQELAELRKESEASKALLHQVSSFTGWIKYRLQNFRK